jgi:hypothetical protein
MIYVHRDWTKVPEDKLKALKALSDALDKIDEKHARKAFIKAHAAEWSEVRGELSLMSHKKCWYTEAREGVSLYQTDHFRPHGRAKQALKKFEEGYCWLAFDIENYRIVGVLTNTQNQEHSDETVGKGDWFPLLEPDKRATLLQRSTLPETPLLLDPTDKNDPNKIEFNENGEAHPSKKLSEAEQRSVDDAIVRLGIRQSLLNGLRRSKWRECARKIDKYDRFYKKPKGHRTPEETETMDELVVELITMASAKSEFSATVRCCLKSRGLDEFAIRDELNQLVLQD